MISVLTFLYQGLAGSPDDIDISIIRLGMYTKVDKLFISCWRPAAVLCLLIDSIQETELVETPQINVCVSSSVTYQSCSPG